MSQILIFYLAVHAIIAAVNVYIISIAFRRYLETRIKLLVLFSVLPLASVLLSINLILPNIFPLIDFHISTFFHNILFSITTISTIWFFAAFEGNPSQIKTIFNIGYLLTHFFVSLFGILYDFSIVGTIFSKDDFISFVWSPLYGNLNNFGMAIMLIWCFMNIQRSIKNALNEVQIKQIKKIRLAFSFFVFVSLPIATIGYYMREIGEIELSIWFSMVFAWIPSTLGFAMLGSVYATSKQVAFLLPQRLDSIIIIHESGIPLLEYNFKEQSDDMQVSLISGAITAVKALMGEAFNISSDIEKIIFKDRDIVLLIKEKIAFILITGKTSMFLKNALANFANLFLKKFKDNLEKFNGNVSVYESAVPDLLKTFGLVERD